MIDESSHRTSPAPWDQPSQKLWLSKCVGCLRFFSHISMINKGEGGTLGSGCPSLAAQSRNSDSSAEFQSGPVADLQGDPFVADGDPRCSFVGVRCGSQLRLAHRHHWRRQRALAAWGPMSLGAIKVSSPYGCTISQSVSSLILWQAAILNHYYSTIINQPFSIHCYSLSIRTPQLITIWTSATINSGTGFKLKLMFHVAGYRLMVLEVATPASLTPVMSG